MKSQLKLSWFADLKAESDLREMAVSFDIQTIAFSAIDMAESVHNGARLGDPIVRYLVNDYKTGMENGDPFPRIVAYKTSTGWVILSGVQRATAIGEFIKEGRLPKDVPIEVYAVATSEKMVVEAIARAGNVAHGGRSSYEERMAHAIHMVKTFGMRVADASKLFMIDTTSINRKLRVEETRKELSGVGIDTSNVVDSAIDELGKLRHEPGTQKNLALLVAQHRPRVERLSQVVARTLKERAKPKQLGIIKEFEKELTAEIHRKSPKKTSGDGASYRKVLSRPRRDSLIRHLAGLSNFLDYGLDGQGFSSLDQFQIAGDDDTKVIRDHWRRVGVRMRMILGRKDEAVKS